METKDCRLEGVKQVYKRVKNEQGTWDGWFKVDSLPSPTEHGASDLKFYPHTKNYSIEMPNGKEIYYVEF